MRSNRGNCYSIPDLLRLLRKRRGDRVQLDVGLPPAVTIKGEVFEIEGPAVEAGSIEEMLRDVADTRHMRIFRESGAVDIVVPFAGAKFLIHAVRAGGEFGMELRTLPM